MCDCDHDDCRCKKEEKSFFLFLLESLSLIAFPMIFLIVGGMGILVFLSFLSSSTGEAEIADQLMNDFLWDTLERVDGIIDVQDYRSELERLERNDDGGGVRLTLGEAAVKEKEERDAKIMVKCEERVKKGEDVDCDMSDRYLYRCRTYRKIFKSILSDLGSKDSSLAKDLKSEWGNLLDQETERENFLGHKEKVLPKKAGHLKRCLWNR